MKNWFNFNAEGSLIKRHITGFICRETYKLIIIPFMFSQNIFLVVFSSDCPILVIYLDNHHTKGET
jgi:hypothetical protein